jgi:hypothetical protein
MQCRYSLYGVSFVKYLPVGACQTVVYAYVKSLVTDIKGTILL